MIKVLQIVTYMGRGGLETMLMNYYRHIDRNTVQFDFLVHREYEADYDEEILAMGGENLSCFPSCSMEQWLSERIETFFLCTPGISNRPCSSGLS